MSFSEYLREQRFNSGEMYARMAQAGSDPMLSPGQVAAILLVDRRTVRRWAMDDGKFGKPTLTEGGHLRIRWSALKAYLEAQTPQPAE